MTQVIKGRRPPDVPMEGEAPHTPLHIVVQDAWEVRQEVVAVCLHILYGSHLCRRHGREHIPKRLLYLQKYF